MNKELREEMEYLINCDDKAITPDVRDDVKMTLDYIDELEKQLKELQKRFDFLMEAHIMSEQELEEKEDRINKASNKLDLIIHDIEVFNKKNATVEELCEVFNIIRDENKNK